MDLFYGRMSGNSARALFGLHEIGAPFTPRIVDPQGGENQTPAYLAVNPMGKIPALADGGFRLWESNAINWYAAEKNPAAGLIPQTVEGRASVQRWLFFQSAHVSPACVPIFMATNRRVQEYWKRKAAPAAAEGPRRDLARWLAVLEGALGGRDWLEGSFSLADVAYAPHLWLVVEGGFDLAPYPAVRTWLERLLARPAWKKTADMVFGSGS
jgi:glutathione S-transferase